MYFKAKTTQMNELRRKNKEHCSPVKGWRGRGGGDGGSRAIFVTLTNEVGCESPPDEARLSHCSITSFLFFLCTRTLPSACVCYTAGQMRTRQVSARLVKCAAHSLLAHASVTKIIRLQPPCKEP